MPKREKIIVALMLLSVVYGAYSLFIEPSLKKSKETASKKSTATLDGLVAEIAESIAGRGSSENGAYVLAQAEADWGKDPFLQTEWGLRDIGDEAFPDTATLASQFVYSGYLKMGGRGIAIINGMEYEVGEAIDEAGYKIKQISASKVVLEITGSGKDFVLLLTETE